MSTPRLSPPGSPPATDPPATATLARSFVGGRLAAPALSGLSVLAAVALLHLRDPHQAGSYAICPWFLLTGTYCPGCGGLRAVNDLSHGELGEAVSSNSMVVALVPVVLLLWLGWLRARWRGVAFDPPLLRLPVLGPLAGVLLGFAVLRNLDLAGWLAP